MVRNVKDLMRNDGGCGVAINGLCSCFDTVVSALVVVCTTGGFESLMGLLNILLGRDVIGSLASAFSSVINRTANVISNIILM